MFATKSKGWMMCRGQDRPLVKLVFGFSSATPFAIHKPLELSPLAQVRAHRRKLWGSTRKRSRADARRSLYP